MQITFDANKKKLDTNPVFGLLVQGENLAESIQITGPKMVGALDLSQLRVAVRMTSAEYETTVEKTLEQTTDGDTITLIWEVDKQFTGSPGKVDVMLVGYGGNEEVIKITSSGMVVQEDKVFGTAPPESTWEQILQQMQDFATQAYESKTAAANSAAAAAASQKVAEEKAAQATNAANEAVKAAETAAADAAAQAAAKTEQQIRQYADDRYARPLVTKTGPASSLEVYPDKLSNLKVYANGFTQQDGSGDPSPTNVRALKFGSGFFNQKVITGQENWEPYSGKQNTYSISAVGGTIYGGVSSRYKTLGAGELGTKDGIYLANTLSIIITDLSCSSADEFKAKLQALYAAGTPLTVWYNKMVNGAEEKWEPGKPLYAPIILTSGEYRATCLELTAPLCEGDSVVSWVKSGCDKVVVFNGSEDEGWTSGGTAGVYATTISVDINTSVYNDGSVGPYISNYLVAQTTNNVYGAITANAFSVSPISKHVLVYLPQYSSAAELKAALAAHPLTVWYRSTNYTPATDIPVSLETHQQAVLALDGTEVITLYWNSHKEEQLANGRVTFSWPMPYPYKSASEHSSTVSHFKFSKTVTSGMGVAVGYQFSATKNVYICLDLSTIDAVGETDDSVLRNKILAYLAAQYAAGTPVTIVYQLATPITYAHPAVELPALPDDTGKVTITGQSGGTVTAIFNKSIIKEIAEIKAAMLAMGANLSM